MSLSMFEIIVLPNGDIALQRASEPGEPVVRICFSSRAKSYLQDHQMDIARAMIDAGIEEFESLDPFNQQDDEVPDEALPQDRVLH